MNIFLKKCNEQIFNYHGKLQKRKIPRYTGELAKDLQECEKGVNPLNKSKWYLYLNIKLKQVRLFLSKVKQYLKVETQHAINGPAPQIEIDKRKYLCKTCPGRVEQLEEKIDPGGLGFCSLCGCGANRRAALSVKLTLAGATCPLNKWQPVINQRNKTKWSNVKDAIKGVLYSIIDQIKI